MKTSSELSTYTYTLYSKCDGIQEHGSVTTRDEALALLRDKNAELGKIYDWEVGGEQHTGYTHHCDEHDDEPLLQAAVYNTICTTEDELDEALSYYGYSDCETWAILCSEDEEINYLAPDFGQEW